MENVLDAGVGLSLAGRVALITGGSRGIGAAAVKMFRQAGARVVFSYRAAEDRARELVQECGGEDVCRGVRQELATPEDGAALVAAAVAAFGRVDCLVVNHGIWPPHDAPIATMTVEQWRGTLGINLDSAFGLVQAAVAQMQRQNANGEARGHIVLVSSTAGQRGEAFHADYAASKGALISLTKSLSSELAGQADLLQLRGSGMGRDRDVGRCPQASGDVQEGTGHDTAGAPCPGGGDCRTDIISVHAACGVRLGRDLQREWRRCAGWLMELE